ncbi:MAG TPA: hypothetical protein GX517_02185 [Alicyclobacillus sp.]|nr:hypothetical protein [Alicyclobacillus sp.]
MDAKNGIATINNRLLNSVDRAYLRRDGEHWVAVQWLSSDGSEDHLAGKWIDCWAWVEGGILFLPSDGQSTACRLDDGTPDIAGEKWYSPEYGKYAIHGIPGSTMSVVI